MLQLSDLALYDGRRSIVDTQHDPETCKIGTELEPILSDVEFALREFQQGAAVQDRHHEGQYLGCECLGDICSAGAQRVGVREAEGLVARGERAPQTRFRE